MDLRNSPYFGALRAQLGTLSERQRLIAENIANASTPGYVPRDVDMASFQASLLATARRVGAAGAGGGAVPLAQTHAGHMTPGGGAPTLNRAAVIVRPDSETTLDGNQVVLEEQTIRAAETRTAFETGLALYQKGLQLMRMASRPPGR